MKGNSLWKEISSKKVQYPSLGKEENEVDVAVVGGGITGITAAVELIKAGKKVALIEANEIGGSTTSRSTGNLYSLVQPLYHKISEVYGLDFAKKVAESRQFAINYIEKNVKTYDINCHFVRRPWYGYTAKESGLFSEEIETLKKMDLAVETTLNLPFPMQFKKAALVENQARFNPLQYVLSMAEEFVKKGGQIYENSVIVNIEKKKPHTLYTANGEIKAENVFIATHTPLGINPKQFCTAPYRSYVVGAFLKEATYPDAQLWAFDDSHHVLSTHSIQSNNPEILFIAGEHHKTGQGQNMQSHFSALESFLRAHFSVEEIAFHWSAQHFQSAAKIPYIGSIKDSSIYLATGFFADGLTYGTLAGILIADNILKKKNSFNDLYKTDYTPSLSSLRFILKENLNVLAQYAQDLPLLTESQFDNLAIGEGRIVEIEREKCAVSRDASNNLHLVSAVCTHMKCIVNWNNAEQTWDCPCHGSRFKPTGELIDGPATANLEYKKLFT